jgi:ubiquitin-like modifier-activating enzyme ATG7
MNYVRFSPPSSSFTPSFWEKLYDNKLNLYKLSNDRIQINACYSIATENNNGQFYFSEDSFVCKIDDAQQRSCTPLVHGEIQNVNSLEEFLSFDKMQLLSEFSSKLVSFMMNKESVLQDPKLLQRFFLLTFADLKSYKFYYWFCQPVIVPESSSSFTLLNDGIINRVTAFSSLFTDGKKLESIYEYLFEIIGDNSEIPFLFLLIKTNEDSHVIHPFSTLEDHLTSDNELYLIILDQSKGFDSFGWNVRNLLTFLAISFPTLKRVNLIGLRNSLLNNRRTFPTASSFSLQILGMASLVSLSSLFYFFSLFNLTPSCSRLQCLWGNSRG